MIKAHILLGLSFFLYFSIRGIFALPDPNLDGALSRLSPIFVLALILWFRPPDLSRPVNGRILAIAPILLLVACFIERLLFPEITRSILLAGNPLILTASAVPLCYLNGFFALRSRSYGLSWLHYAGVFASLIVIGTLGSSRMPFAAALLGVVIHLGWSVLFGKETRKIQLRHGVIILFIALLAIFSSLVFGGSAAKFLKSASGPISSLQGDLRFEMWSGAIQAIAEKPIFGFGPQNRWAGLEGFVAPEVFNIGYTHVHNIFITVGMAGGIVGIVLVLGYMLVPSFIGLQSNMTTWANKELLVIGPITVLAMGMTNVIFFEALLAVISVLALIGPYFLLSGGKDAAYNW